MLLLRIAVDFLQSSPPIESSLHLMLIPFVQIRHRSMDLACHPGLGPLLKTVRVQGMTTAVTFVTVAVRKNAIWNDSFLATRLATVEGPVHGDHLLLKDWNFHRSHTRNTRCDSHQGGHLRNTRCYSHQEGHPLQENGIRTKGVTLSKANRIRIKRVTLSRANRIRFSPPPQRMGFSSRESPSQQRMEFASRGPPSPKRMGFPLKGSPSPSEWDSHQEGHPLQSEWDSLLAPGLVAARDPFQGILLQGHATQGIPFLQRASPLCLSEWDSLQEILLLPNDNVLSRGTQILLDDGIHSELRLVRLQLRDPSRGLLPPILIHLYDKIRKLKTPLCQPQLRP